MNKKDIEPDTMFIRFTIKDEGMSVASGYNITENVPEEDRGRYAAIVHGIVAMLEVEPDRFIRAAAYAQHGVEMAEAEAEQDLKELFEKSDLTNILDFKGKMQ